GDGGGRIGHGHGDVVEILTHPVILAASRPMDELKLEPVGIGEEQRMVTRAVGRILGGRVEDAGAEANEQRMKALDVLAARGMPGEVMKAGTVTIVIAIRARGLQTDRADEMPRVPQIPVDAGGIAARAAIAEEAQHLLVEGGRPGEVAGGEIDVVDGAAHAWFNARNAPRVRRNSGSAAA